MTEPARSEESIFMAATQLGTAQEREAYVNGACGDDERLRRRVLELLSAYDASRGPLDQPPPGVENGATVDPPLSEKPGMRIGPYRLLQQIGEGGFGVVFMAEQIEPIRRKVALKIIKPGMDTRQVISRFEAERQALALMDHPNIARVLDAGSTESGRPYFVMELVRGIPITDYCDQNNLAPRERMELFSATCRALQHAHQKGIVHRDVKPANVLVTLHDGTPMVKVIDFGISKALDKPLTERTLFTEFGQLIGTPLYMSPEQADLSYLDVDSRTDIYALGVLLYELLTGATPFDKERLHKAAFDEIRRIIREEDPPVPSKKISTMGESLPQVSARRAMEPRRLSALLRGDLDWIVMKALEKDRTRRYSTAEDFAEDIERHLRDETVHARPPSAAYRTRKFLRRNRRLVVPAGLAIAALLVGVVIGLSAFRDGGWRVDSNVAARHGSDNKMQPNLEVFIHPTKIAVTIKGQGRSETMSGTGLHSVHVPPGKYQLFGSSREQGIQDKLLGNVTIAENGSQRLSVFGLDQSEPQTPQLELYGHNSDVACLACSSDGSILATGSQDGTVRLWRRTNKTWEQYAVLQDYAQGLAFAPSGDTLATACDSRPVRFWDTASGELKSSWEVLARSLAYAPDGQTLALGLRDGQVELWDVEVGQRVSLIGQHDAYTAVTSLAFSPDGKMLASANDSLRGTVILWDVAGPAEVRRFVGHTAAVIQVAFSPDGKMLATAGMDRTIRVWDVQSGAELDVLSHDRGWWARVLWLDDRFLVTNQFCHVRFWDVEGGDLRREIKTHWNGTNALLATPDGKTLVTAGEGRTVRFWSLPDILAAQKAVLQVAAPGPAKYQVIVRRAGFEKSYADLEFHEEVVPPGPCRVEIHSPRTGELLRSGSLELIAGQTRRISCGVLGEYAGGELPEPLYELPCGEAVSGVAVSPDGSNLATAVWGSGVKLWTWDGTAWQRRRTLRCTGHNVIVVAFSPDGAVLAVGGEGMELELWDLATGKRRATLSKDGLSHANCVAFSPIGGILASAHQSGHVVVWDWTKAEELATFSESEKAVYAVAASPDGRFLAAGGDDGTVSVWDIERRDRIRVLCGHTGAIQSLAFSPDGEILSSFANDTTIRLWDLESGTFLRVLTDDMMGGAGPIAFSADGKTLASSDWSDTAYLWDVESGALRRRFAAGWRWGACLTFSPKDGALITGSGDFAARIWSVEQLCADQTPSSPVPQPDATCIPAGYCTSFSGPDNTLAIGNWFGNLSLWQADQWAAPLDVPVLPDAPIGMTPGMGLHSVVFHPQGKWLATATRDSKVNLWDWDAASQTLNSIAIVESDRTDSPLAMSPAELILACGRANGVVRLLSAETGEQLRELTSSHGGIASLAFSHEGKLLAVGTDNGYVLFWDVKSGKLAFELQHGAGHVRSVAFDRESNSLVSAGDDSKVQVWDLATRQPRLTLGGHSAIVYSAAFSPDNRLLVTAGGDADVADPWQKRAQIAEIKLWDVATGQLLREFAGHRDTVVQAYFLPDRKTLVTTGLGFKTHLWDVKDLLSGVTAVADGDMQTDPGQE